MKNKFYSHLVQIDFLHAEIDSLELEPHEREELLHHVHGSIHVTVLDIILSDLPEEHKKTFLEHLVVEDHSALWEHLLRNTVGIEEKIKERVLLLAQEFTEDIKKVKKK